MKLLTFQAARFAWKAHVLTLPPGSEGSAEPTADDLATDAVVVFAHAESKDAQPEARERTLRHAHKHVKWLANKRGLKSVVLHSFAHLGGDAGPGDVDPDFARRWLLDLAEKLRANDYGVKLTPFGWSCAWELSVFGEPLAKVWKEI